MKCRPKETKGVSATAASNTTINNKILKEPVTIIQVNLFSMIWKKDGPAAIKLSMIGINSKNSLLAPLANTLILNKKHKDSISLALSKMRRKLLKSKKQK